MQQLDYLLDLTLVTYREGEPWQISYPNDSWKLFDAGIWRHITYDDLAQYGWKVHISSTLENAPSVLRIVSSAAFQLSCSFKYLRGADSFRELHFKNASRLQSGKFIALYPTNATIARALMELLHAPLENFKGLDILTDRSFKNSSSIYYRWGAFRKTGRVNLNGEAEELVPNGRGELVPDLRQPHFTLPDGIKDPFISEGNINQHYGVPKKVNIDQFEITSVLRFTNAGGRYKGTCKFSGTNVVLKEARPGTGFVGRESAIPRLRREATFMEIINQEFKGLSPRIIKEFAIQDHYYIAIEFIDGIRLSEWIAQNNPLYSCGYTDKKLISLYFHRVLAIFSAIRDDLAKLHSIGIAFGDLSVGNIIITDDGGARLIDFESCTSLNDTALGLRTPDFCLLEQLGELTAKERDIYALNSLAIAFVLRLTTIAEISPYVLRQLNQELSECVKKVPTWFLSACEHLTRIASLHSAYHHPNFVPASLVTLDGRRSARTLLCDGLLGSYSIEEVNLFPTGERARQGAAISFEFGSTGVLLALIQNGCQIDHGIIDRYRDVVERSLYACNLPMNYGIGYTSLIDICSIIGLDYLANEILEKMRNEWTLVDDPSLSRGLAGIALTFARHGNVDLGNEVIIRALEISKNFLWNKNGLLFGRSGVFASACNFHDVLYSSREYTSIISHLITEEIEQLVRHPSGNSLSLRGEVGGNRLLPYLSDGTAGFLLAALLANRSDWIDFSLEADLLTALTADLGTPFMLEGSLMDGAAGLAVVLDVARSDFPNLSDRIPKSNWNRISKYFLPLGYGMGVFHPKSLKFDLSYSQGSSGIANSLLWYDGLSDLNISGLILDRRSHDLAED